MTREDTWGKFRYMDREGTWEVSSRGFSLIKDPEETERCIHQWPTEVCSKVINLLSKDNIVLLKGTRP